jgi:hypothetical protein
MIEPIEEQGSDKPASLTVEAPMQRSHVGLVPRSAAFGSRTPTGGSHGRTD